MCAVDALGIGAMTDHDIAIASRCRHCGAPIGITAQDRGRALAQIEPRTAVMWQSVRYEGGCAANSLCATTAFFCSDDHLSAWCASVPQTSPDFGCRSRKDWRPVVLSSGRALRASMRRRDRRPTRHRRSAH